MLAFFIQCTDVQYADPKDQKKILICPVSSKNRLHKWRQDIVKSFFKCCFETAGAWGEGSLEGFWMKAHSMNFWLKDHWRSVLSLKCPPCKWIFSICYNQDQWSHRLNVVLTVALRISKESSLHKLMKYAIICKLKHPIEMFEWCIKLNIRENKTYFDNCLRWFLLCFSCLKETVLGILYMWLCMCVFNSLMIAVLQYCMTVGR